MIRVTTAIIMLVGIQACTPASIQPVETASENFALLDLDAACVEFEGEVENANERIENVPADVRSIAEIVHLQTKIDAAKELCTDVDQPGTSAIAVRGHTEDVKLIDGAF